MNILIVILSPKDSMRYRNETMVYTCIVKPYNGEEICWIINGTNLEALNLTDVRVEEHNRGEKLVFLVLEFSFNVQCAVTSMSGGLLRSQAYNLTIKG